MNKKISKKPRLLLETSVQIRRLVRSPKMVSLLNTDIHQYNFYSSYYVLHEFKVGFIYSLIDYYLTAEAYEEVADAKEDWSNKYAKRDLTNYILLDAYINRVSGDVSTSDKGLYMAQLEAGIVSFLNNFDTDLVAIVGGFSDDPAVNFKISGKEDFPEFFKKFKNHFIPLETFWTVYNSDLQTLLLEGAKHKNKKGDYKSGPFCKILKVLDKINVDLTKANGFVVCKSIGDAVIAVDITSGFTIATLDKSFMHLCPPLKKDFKKYDLRIG